MVGLTRNRTLLLKQAGWVIGVIFLCASIGFVPTLARTQTFSFSNVEVQGNERVDAATILTQAGIERGQPVSAAQLNAALQNIQNSGLFETVEIIPRGNTLVITVEEFPTINRIAFEGNRRLNDEILSSIISSTSRRVYSPSQAEADADAITDAYREGGRLAATVVPKIIRRSDNRVDLVFEITEGRVVEIERISFVGNRNFTDRRLRRVLETKQAGIFRQIVRSDTLIEDRIEFDKQVLRDFYLSRGHIDFETLSVTSELNRNRSGFVVTFDVREGQQFRFGETTVTSDIDTIDPEAYAEEIRVRSGSVYNPAIVENAIARLERVAVREGENFVRVEPRINRNDRDLTLDVEFNLSRGPRVFVERIDIEGNTTTLDRVVRRQFDVVEGDPFNPREIRESASRIRALGFFENAEVEAREGSAPDRVIVDVDVEEAPTGSLGFGASFGSDDGFGLTFSFSETNFLGRGQQLTLEFNTTEDAETFNLGFVEPSFLGRDVAFTFNALYRQTVNDNSRFSTRRGEITPGFQFPLNERSRLGVRAGIQNRELFDVDTGDDLDPQEDTGSSFILREEEGSRTSGLLGYSYTYDSRNTGLNPNAGLLFRFNQDFGFGDDFSYIRTTALASAETKVLNDEVTLRAEFEGGAINFQSGSSTVLDRFTLNNRIRGFEANGTGPRDLNVTNEDALGGNMFAVLRLEADFPLGLPEEYGISGGVFYDAGSVWSLDNTNGGPAGLDPVDDDFALRQSIGVSIFWDTPLGPLRFNFSEVLSKEEGDEERPFDLTVSTRF
ncbi:MAG: outer membrane protein assembly factor BamA [Pseudomonadota bacterium]